MIRYRPFSHNSQPPHCHEPYLSSVQRAPLEPLVPIPQTVSEITGPLFGKEALWPQSHDLTKQHDGEPIGQRILVTGRVTDERGKGIAETLIEIWQANAAGRYRHDRDHFAAPLDPNFTGRGAVVTDEKGRFSFTTIKPGAYPWPNHWNAWRPAHIHLSLFGPSFATRLVTQMYFDADPLLAFDPIFNAIPDVAARDRLVARLDWDASVPERALAYRFDIVLRGGEEAPMEG